MKLKREGVFFNRKVLNCQFFEHHVTNGVVNFFSIFRSIINELSQRVLQIASFVQLNTIKEDPGIRKMSLEDPDLKPFKTKTRLKKTNLERFVSKNV